ncbi:MAG TPA: tetratricopeptide repeat protein [Phycisphaerae bacterium]
MPRSPLAPGHSPSGGDVRADLPDPDVPFAAFSVATPLDAQETIPVRAPHGIRVGRYELVSIIGSGGQGEVWLARHPHLAGWCVLKFLRTADGASRAGDVARLMKEASRGFKVSHGNVARVMDCDQHEGRWFLVMEFVDGADLASLLGALGPLLPEQTVHISVQFLAGLEAIHEAGLIHRDVKPANLLLTPRGTVKMTDLGVATLQQGFQTLTDMTTMSPMFVGTPHYAAPEQFTLLEPPDPRTDVYAAGATIFHLLTGRPPFEGHTLEEIARQQVHAPAPSLVDARRTGYPDAAATPLLLELDRVIAGALAKNRAERPGSCAELADQLRRRLPESPAGVAARTVVSARGIAVLPFRNLHRNPADDWIADGLAAEIESALSRIPGIQVGDRHTLQQRVRNAFPPDSGSAADATYFADLPEESLLTAARWIGAGTVVCGAYQRVGEQIRITASILRGDQRTARNIVRISGTTQQLFDLEDQVAAGIVQQLGYVQPDTGAAAPGTARTAREPRPANVEAYQRFLRADRAFHQGDYRTALSLAEQSLVIDSDYKEAIGLIGMVHTRLGHYDQALERFRQQERLALAAGDAEFLAAVFANMGAMHYYTGQYERALELLRQATELESAIDQRSDFAKNRCNMGNVLLRLDRPEEALAAFNEAIEIHRSLGDLVNLIPCYNGAGRCMARLGRTAEAREHFQRALLLGEEVGSRVDAGMSRLNLANLAVAAGEFETAEREFAASLAHLEHSGLLNGLLQLHEHMAEMYLKRGRIDDAIHCVQRRIETAAAQKNVSAEAEAWEQMAKALEKAGRTMEAMDALRNAYKTSRKPGTLRVANPGTIRPPRGPGAS